MSNMSYCRYENTLRDLIDCYDHWNEEPEAEDERKAKTRMLKLIKEMAEDCL